MITISKTGLSLASVLLLVSLQSACNPANIKRGSNLEETLLHYKIMMNRSDFVAAARFRLPTAPWDVRGLERFQLSHYEIKQSEFRDGGNTLEQTVFLRYFNRINMRERSTYHKEIWRYDSKSKQWQLDGEPPVFN